MDNQITQFLVIRPGFKGEFWLQIYGCLSHNSISIFGCPATFLVVPGARTTKILNTGFISLTAMGTTASIVTRVKIDRISAT